MRSFRGNVHTHKRTDGRTTRRKEDVARGSFVFIFIIGLLYTYHFVVADGGNASKHEVDIDDGGSICKQEGRRLCFR